MHSKQGKTRTIHADLSVIFKIALVGDDNNREGVPILYTKDLLVEMADFLERTTRGNRVDEKETFASAHVLLSHGSGLGVNITDLTEQRALMQDSQKIAAKWTIHFSACAKWTEEHRGERSVLLTHTPPVQRCQGRRGEQPRRQ